MDKPSKEDEADLRTPFLPLHAVLACEPGCFGAARALTKLAGSSAAPKEAQGSNEWVVAQAEPRHRPCPRPPRPQPSSQEEERQAGKTTADGPELRAGSFKRRMNADYVVKAFEPNREGSTGVT